MSDQGAEKDSARSGSGCILTVMYLAAALLWILGLGLLMAALSAIGLLSDEAAEGVVVVSLTVVAFLGGLVLIGVMLARWCGDDIATAFAWHRRGAVVLWVSLLAGLCFAPTSSWFAQLLIERFEALDISHMESIVNLLCDGPVAGRLLFAAVVLLVAPLGEELVFRGFLWSALERGSSRWIAWILTSVLFALYHGDPLHVLSVLPLGLALGWLRMVSRSIWPSIAVHFGNNVIAVLWTLQSGGDADQEVSVGLGAACALVSITCLGSLRLFQSPRRDARE